MDSRMRRSVGLTMALISLTEAMGTGEAGAPEMPRLPEPRPENYYVHLTKAQRRGKTPEQLRELRRQAAGS